MKAPSEGQPSQPENYWKTVLEKSGSENYPYMEASSEVIAAAQGLMGDSVDQAFQKAAQNKSVLEGRQSELQTEEARLLAELERVRGELQEVQGKLRSFEDPTGILEEADRRKIWTISSFLSLQQRNIEGARRFMETDDPEAMVINLRLVVKALKEHSIKYTGWSGAPPESCLTEEEAWPLFEALCHSYNFTLEEAERIYEKYCAAREAQRQQEDTREQIGHLSINNARSSESPE